MAQHGGESTLYFVKIILKVEALYFVFLLLLLWSFSLKNDMEGCCVDTKPHFLCGNMKTK